MTLESDDEDNLLKVLQAEKEQQRQEMQAHMDAAREAMKELEGTLHKECCVLALLLWFRH